MGQNIAYHHLIQKSKFIMINFLTIDFDNTLRCFSLKDGKEIWNIKTENSFIKSQKKFSMLIKDKFLFI